MGGVKVQEGGVEGEDSMVLGMGSGATTSCFVIGRVQIHEGLCPVMCCVRVCRCLYLLRFRFCDVFDTCIAWDVRRLCGVM